MHNASRAKKVGQILAIRNAFGDGTEGVSSVFNIFSPAIRKWRVEGGKGGAVARDCEARAAWTMYPPCGDEISARLMIAQ